MFDCCHSTFLSLVHFSHFSAINQSSPRFSPSTLQHQLHAAFTLVLFRWLVVSINQEMALWLCELLNNADFYFCYVIKMLMTSTSACVNTTVTALPRCTRACLSPATSFFGGRTLITVHAMCFS